ncbi:DUF2141 domain-containing protein [Pseudofulvibacter geojedonensis]|uniref:DUF2141 domain-containing protein n=1 Tax=Pseudofulvibacter geojedonensis TaxID=1123758 RepID=A0ABW3I584_9FLAO
MKTIALLITMLISSLFAKAQEKNTTGITITVTIPNAKNDNGKMLLGLHSKETFMKAKALSSASSIIKDGKVTITFNNIPEGEYAIMVLHDENLNNRMDFELNGMPKEAYGISNNPMSYGPPQFEEGKFTVANKDLDFEIRL